MQLFERYRPQTWAEVVGQDRAIAIVKAVAKYGYAGRAWFITGARGTGKTTIARLIAREVAEDLNVIELGDGAALDQPQLDRLVRQSDTYGMSANGKHGRAFIVNEAHGLKPSIIRQLLGLLDPCPPHVAWIFTTTAEAARDMFGQSLSDKAKARTGEVKRRIDAPALAARCTEIELSRCDLVKAFAARLLEIAGKEGFNVTLEQCVRLLKDMRNDLRRAIEHLPILAVNGEKGGPRSV